MIEISCAFATSLATPDLLGVATTRYFTITRRVAGFVFAYKGRWAVAAPSTDDSSGCPKSAARANGNGASSLS